MHTNVHGRTPTPCQRESIPEPAITGRGAPKFGGWGPESGQGCFILKEWPKRTPLGCICRSFYMEPGYPHWGDPLPEQNLVCHFGRAAKIGFTTAKWLRFTDHYLVVSAILL